MRSADAKGGREGRMRSADAKRGREARARSETSVGERPQAHLAHGNGVEAPFRRHEVELHGIGHLAPLRGFSRETLGFRLHLFDVADHVEGGFGQVVVFTGNHGLEGGDGVREVD